VKWEKEVLKKTKVESTDGQRSGVHVGSSPASSQVLRIDPEVDWKQLQSSLTYWENNQSSYDTRVS
jgi:hypothetical protein